MNGIDLYFITQDETFQEYCFTLENSSFIPSTGDYIDLKHFIDLVVYHYSGRNDLAQEKENFYDVFHISWIVGKKWWTIHHKTKRVTVEINLHNGDKYISQDINTLGNMTLGEFKKNVFL